MLTTRQLKAIDLLLNSTEKQTADALNIKYITIIKWMSEPEFNRALREAENRRNKSLIRIAGNAVLNAATAMPSGIDIKTAIDLLKLSKALEQEMDIPENNLCSLLQNTPD